MLINKISKEAIKCYLEHTLITLVSYFYFLPFVFVYMYMYTFDCNIYVHAFHIV